MPKINQEEYEVLKELDDKWKWIARDKDRGLYAFTEKPVRKYDSSPYWDTETEGPYSALELIDEIHLFQFIQWEDEEPYNIAELIEEYESSQMTYFDRKLISEYERLTKESEETEVKKVVNLSVSFDRGLETYPKMSVDEAIETLTDYGTRYAVVEKPVIPQFVADWIEHNHEDDLSDTIHFTIYGLYADWPDTNTMVELRKPVLKWLGEDRNNYFKLIDATRYGYEVEEEQKYRVIDSHNVYLLAKDEERNKVETIAKFVEIYGYEHAELDYNLTEQEIKDYDPRYMTFAKPVEEMEE